MLRHAVDLCIGVLELGLGVLVLLHFSTVRRHMLWLVALVLFFVLRGVDRIIGTMETPPAVFGKLIDPLLLVVLVLLLFSLGRILRGLELSEAAAQFREREYFRAVIDYRRLARHRLASPVTAILGSSRLLLDLKPDDTELRDELVEILEDAVARLESTSLDPWTELAAEERTLKPLPSLFPE